MSKKTIAELKEYFKATKRPTEKQFADLLDSYLHLDDSPFTENYTENNNLYFSYNSQLSDQAIDILLGNVYIHGCIEVELVGHKNFPTTQGVIKKQILASGSVDNIIWGPLSSRVVEASGEIVNNMYIGDIVWDSVARQYKISIYRTTNTGNGFSVKLTHHSAKNKIVDKAVLSAPYTKPLIGERKHSVNYNGNVGIGTTLPEAKLHTKETKALGNVNYTSAVFERNEAAGGSNKILLKYHSTAGLELNSGYSANGFSNGSYSDLNIINNRPDMNNDSGGINFVTNGGTRMNIAANGNISIGGLSNSKQQLTINGAQSYDEGGPTNGKNSNALLRLQSSDEGFGEVLDFGMNIQSSYGWIQPQDFNNANAFYDLALNPKGGNVGIGVTVPEGAFDVHFPGEPKTIKFLDTINMPGTMNSMVRFTWYNDTADVGVVRSGGQAIEALALRINQKEIARFTPNGNAAFQGKVEAKNFVVSSTPTADFVFAADYNLKPIQDVEKFISEKNHLPEIPSAKEMTENGVEIGNFQIKLLQKIEELTLYLISQNKEIENLKKIVNYA